MTSYKRQKRKLKTPLRPARYLNPEIAGYIAGFIDGEGTITKNQVSMCNTDFNVILFLQETIGGHLSLTKNHLQNPKHSKSWNLSLRAEEQIALLPQIIPYLRIKREKAINRFFQLFENN